MNEKETIIPAKMTREQFELRVVNIETIFHIAFESAKTMKVYGNSARDVAKQRRMNMMVDQMICQLEEETNITVATTRIEDIGRVPFPPRVNRLQTMLNWDNNR